MLAYFYVLDPCCLTRSRLLPCFVHSVGLCLLAFGTTWLFGHIRPSYGLFGCNHLWECIPVMLVCSMHTLFHPVWWSTCIACSVPSCLALFVSLHLCTFAYMFMHASLCVLVCVIKLSSYNLMRVHTRPWYTRPRVPFRNFAWWHMYNPYSNLIEPWTSDPNLHFVL